MHHLTLVELESNVRQCTKCPLHWTRTKTVFARGNPQTPIMLIGEAPGEHEDLTGTPFVGRAGHVLDAVLDDVSLTDKVYIANVLKCRPPNNRKPTKDEMDACGEHLGGQLGNVMPHIIVLLSATVLEHVVGMRGLIKARGKWLRVANRDAMPTVHPAYCLRVPEGKSLLRDDLRLVKERLDQLTQA